MSKRKSVPEESGSASPASGVVARPFHMEDVDPATLKAFAHPLRMRMYTYLRDHGAATASRLAEAMGESTGQTSYHLRQLARHGLIGEDTGRGTARERWWEAKGFSAGLGTVDADPSAMTTLQLVQRQGIEERRRRQLEWVEWQSEEERAWLEAVAFTETTTRMSPDELRALVLDITDLIEEHLEAVKQARAEDDGAGTRMVKIYGQFFPLPPE